MTTNRPSYCSILLSILNDSGPLTEQQINKKIFYSYQQQLEDMDTVWTYQDDIVSVRDYLIDNKSITQEGDLFSVV